MIAIVDYEAGNLTSVKKALDYLGAETIITSIQRKLRRRTKSSFPGLGILLQLKSLTIPAFGM